MEKRACRPNRLRRPRRQAHQTQQKTERILIRRQARAKLNIDKKKTLVVGDMAIDIMTARNSGAKSCWVTYGLGKREDVEPLEPDFVINDMAELKKIMN